MPTNPVPSNKRVRASRKRSEPTPDPVPLSAPLETSKASREIHDAIEDERSRLMTAEALLHCVVMAMNDDDGDVHGPNYPTLVALARDLVRQSIDQLDSMRLRPMMTKLDEFLQVKEEPVKYVH